MCTWMLLLWMGTGDLPAVEAARDYYQSHAADILAEYVNFLKMPNVASDIPNIQRNADYLVAQLAKRGVTAELLTLPDAPPVVFGERRTPGATKTLILYVHYDGQPVDPSRWTNNPWQPTLYTAAIPAGGTKRPMPKPGERIDPDWRLYARSASDDKCPFPALFTALDALAAADIDPTVNLKFFFEGEEEAGSPNLGRYLETFRDKLAGDIWLFLDGPMHQSRKPQVMLGVRGVTGLEVTVYGATRSLHSGHYGNYAPVPGQQLALLLASMKDESGRVLIDGFYDTVAPLTDAEKTALAALPAYDEQLRKELGLAQSEMNNAPYFERMLLPTLTVKGLSSGNVGAKARNVIPNQATASLGVRLVKGNDPAHMLDLVEAHIAKQGYHIVRQEPNMATRLSHAKIAKVTRSNFGYPAARSSLEHPVVAQVIDRIRQVTRDDLYVVPTLGGSLPLHYFTGEMGRPAIIVPIANHDNNQHAPDENLRLGNLQYGVELYAALLTMD